MSNTTRSTQYHLPQSKFPLHNSPRVWFLAVGNSPIGISITRQALAHGDFVVSGVNPIDWELRRAAYHDAAATASYAAPSDASSGAHVLSPDRFRALFAELRTHADWRQRFKLVELDPVVASSVSVALADARASFGRIDILLLNNSSTLIGTIEELGGQPAAVKEQFAVTFSASVNLICGVLPYMREKRTGHIMLLSGITGHLGTPGLGLLCASQWAIEGYCDGIAYEVAPFGVRVSIVQANMEVGVLTNRIVKVPEMDAYTKETGNDAPLARGLIGGLIEQLREAYGVQNGSDASGHDAVGNGGLDGGTFMTKTECSIPVLPLEFEERLIGETVQAILAIGGHENPPGRHIVGHEGVASVKEKLKTVSEELEEFVEVSSRVDFERD